MDLEMEEFATIAEARNRHYLIAGPYKTKPSDT
jgi:hypothetical protein